MEPSKSAPLTLGLGLLLQMSPCAFNKYIMRILQVPGWPGSVYTSGFGTFTEWAPRYLYIIATRGSCFLRAPENQLTFLNSLVSHVGTFYNSWFLKSPTSHTSISGSCASHRHTPPASPQARSSPGSHIFFNTEYFYSVRMRQRSHPWVCKLEVHYFFQEKIYIF